MRYIKRIKNNVIVGLGYVSEDDVLIQMFSEVADFEQIEIDNEEFIKLSIEKNFIGMYPSYGEIPIGLFSSHF